MPREIALLLVMTAALALCATRALAQNDRVAYAPDIVGVGRMFMVVLNVPADAPEIEVTVPDTATLFDRTPLPTESGQRRYYFRSVAPTEACEIRFAHPEGEVVVSIVIWSFDDLRQFRELKGTVLPRRWPLGEPLPELKQSRTVMDEADVEAAKGGSPGRGTTWAAMPDDQIWDMQPDSTIPRWHWVNVTHGCPVHGADIYKVRAYYPWIKDVAVPWKWKIECPVGHELYPSNDFANGDMTSGPFPDDGFGGACVHNGKKYGFIAEISQAYCHQMMQVAPDCARAYLATGEVKYLHTALVGFCRLAVEYAYLGTMTQHRHRNSRSQVDRLGPAPFSEGPNLRGAGFTVYCIDQPGYQWRHAEAYESIFPDIDRDPEIIPYLQSKGLDVNTHEDVRRFIEENLFAVWMQGAMDGATSSNEPHPQRGLARMAEILNYKRGDEFMDWLYDGAGKMRIFVPNTFFRDGSAYESTGGYNSMHVTALGPIIESIEHLRQMRPEVYPESKYPSLSKSRRYKSVFDFCMDTVLIDRSYAQMGDGGGHPSYSKLAKRTWYDADTAAFEHAYRLFPEPKFAWALVNAPGWRPSKGFGFTREQMEQAAEAWPDDWNDASSVHDGYGVAILRGGKADDKRALWLRYGRARSHTQDDIMDIGLQAYEGILLSHMGYPRNWGYWEYSWSSHNLARQFPGQSQVAQAQLMADAGIAHITEARCSAHPEYGNDGTRAEPDPDYWQRRMLALVDVGPQSFYCVDFYRISGGEDHWWAFHGQEGEFSTEGIDLQRQETGTLAGADVPYGDTEWMKANGCSLHPTYGWRGMNFVFPHLYNVQRGKSTGPWSCNWVLDTGEGLNLRTCVVEARGAGPDRAPLDVNICDGKAASGGSPYEMKWLMLHNNAPAPARSQIVSIIEPHMGEPLIKQARPITLSGDDEAGFVAHASQLTLADRTDTVLFSADASVERQAEGGFAFAGRFGLYAEQGGEPVAISLIGGTKLTKDGFGITLDSPEYRGKITAVDRETHSVTVSPAPATLKALIGATIFIANATRRVAYKVVDARATAEGAELSLYTDCCIGTGQVSGASEFLVASSTPFTLQRYGYYQGARLVNADATAEYTINEVRSGAGAMIDKQAHPDATAEKLAEQFPKGTWFRVYDYGVGDELIWPYAVSVVRKGPQTYEVSAPVPVRLTLPDGASG